MSQEIRISCGGTEIYANTKPSLKSGIVIILENIEGWDDIAEEKREVVPKLGAEGDFVSSYAHRENKDLEIVMSITSRVDNVIAFRQTVSTILSQDEFIRLRLKRNIGNTPTIEEYYAYVRSAVLWKQEHVHHARVSIPLRTISPRKSISINGGDAVKVL